MLESLGASRVDAPSRRIKKRSTKESRLKPTISAASGFASGLTKDRPTAPMLTAKIVQAIATSRIWITSAEARCSRCSDGFYRSGPHYRPQIDPPFGGADSALSLQVLCAVLLRGITATSASPQINPTVARPQRTGSQAVRRARRETMESSETAVANNRHITKSPLQYIKLKPTRIRRDR